MTDKQTYGFSQRLWRWFERMGFQEDPFALYQAEKEGESLLSFYVDRPYLYDILGNPAYPQTAFLMAQQGHGKTASREILAYQCMSGKLRRRALAIHYSDFSNLLSQVQGNISQITARDHVENIIRAILKTMVQDVPATYFDLLQDVERSLLNGYVKTFADPISQLKMRAILKDDPANLAWEALSTVELLTALADVFIQLGQAPDRTYQSLYILVDRVDETSAGPESAAALLESLVTDKVLLSVPNIAFKFFLPLDVGQRLHTLADLRPDRLCTRIIDWNKPALEDVIRQRLIHYSNGKIESLGDIAMAAARDRVTDRLIDASGSSPRTLLRLCQELIYTHVTRTDDALINNQDVAATLSNFFHREDLITTHPLITTTDTIADPEPESKAHPHQAPREEKGLHIDISGHVWIDGEQLTPALTQQEFALVRLLYDRSPNILTHQELIDIIWPEKDWQEDEAYDEQNLRKLVSRVRQRLEPEVPARKSRFVKSVHGRGYWLNRQ
jgi:hypothetical protein